MKHQTYDIVLCATLLQLQGPALDGIEMEGARGLFHLSGVEQTMLDHFEANDCWVEPKSFNRTIRKLNHQIKQLQTKSFVTR